MCPKLTRATRLTRYGVLLLCVSVNTSCFKIGGVSGSGDSQMRLQRALFREQQASENAANAAATVSSEARYQFLLGELALAGERQEEALEHYEKAVALETAAAPTLRLRLAAMYLQAKRLDEALEQLTIASEANPDNAEVLQLRAGVLATLRREQEAIAAYRKLIQLRGEQSEEPYIFAASLHLQAGQLDEAKQLLGELLIQHPRSFFGNYYLARIAEAQSQFSDAESYYRKALELSPRADSVRIDLARLYGAQKRFDDALRVIEEVLGRDENNVEAKTIKAQLLLGQNKISEAVDEFEEVSTLEEDSTKTRFRIALIKLQQRNLEGAITDLNLVLAENSDNTAARYYLASAYAGLGQTADAIQQIRSIAPGKEYFSESRTLGAFLYQREQKFPEAIALIEEVLAEKEEPKLLAFLANLQKDSGEERAAVSTMRKLVAKEPDNDQHYFTLGVYLDQSGERAEAIKAMRKAIELNPTSANALNYLGYTFAEDKVNLEEAVELIKRALVLEPNNGYYIDSLGWAYFQMGKYNEALVELERAVELVGNDAVILEHLAEVYRVLNRPADARKTAEKALEYAPDSDDKGVTGRLKKLLQALP